MKKFLIVLSILLVAGAAAAWALSDTFGKYSWRYKMTVEVETPEGIKSGSAVREISNGIPIINLPDTGNPASTKGEAVVVDLGQRGVVFVLISHQSDQEFYQVFPANGPSTPDGIRHYANLPSGKNGILNPERAAYFPRLVTFEDLSDPKSVKLVYSAQRTGPLITDPIKITDHFEELFGEGVKLKQITLEITDEEVTWGVVHKWLSWLEGLTTALDGSVVVTSSKLANNLGRGSFIQGEVR